MIFGFHVLIFIFGSSHRKEVSRSQVFKMETLRYIFVMICCLASLSSGWRMSYVGQNLKKMGVVMNTKYEVIKKTLEKEDAQFQKKAAIAKAYEEGIKAALERKKEPPPPLPRNYYENVFPGYKMQPVPEKKVAPLIRPRNRIETRQASHVQSEKRSMIEKLNYAALHRNVIYDSVGGDPYGGPSPVLSTSDYIFPKRRRRRSAKSYVIMLAP